MINSYIDPEYAAPFSSDRLTNLCWLAREILGAYMAQGLKLCDEPEDGSDAEESEDNEDVPIIHDTSLVELNHYQRTHLSNTPYVLDFDESLVPWTEPGFVAFRAEPTVEDEAHRTIEISNQHDQLIFQVPNAVGNKAAIFHGYELNENLEIASGDTKSLQKIDRLLRCMQVGLRYQMITRPEVYEASYHAYVPRLSTGALFESSFWNTFGE